MDESALTSAQAQAYSTACSSCAMGLSLAAGPLADIGDPAGVPDERQFQSRGANALYGKLDEVGGELKAARGRLGELTSLLNRKATHYSLLATRLAERELAEEALRSVTGP
jgi:hypothetical protein